MRLFCFPYGGVGASMFAEWPPHIGHAEVCPIQFPGRENRISEGYFGSYQQLATDLCEALRPWLTAPFGFFGHCSGALVAFETVLRLQELELPSPELLVASGQVAPHDCPFDRLLDLDDDGLRAELLDVIRSRGVSAHPALVDVALRVLRDDLDAARQYHRSVPIKIDCPITAVHWDRDVEIDRGQLDGWLRYSDQSQVVVLSGGHYDVLAAPESLISLLSTWNVE
jgi:surfactin synthase thioesterase subunit